jgi:hypothetical protein
VQQGGDGDVVRQVGHQRRRLVGQLGPLQVKDVAVEHRQPIDLAVGMLGDGLRQLPRQKRIDLHGGHPGAPIEQGKRQGTQTGADLEDVVMPIDPGRRNDATNGVGVVDEVLAE